MNRFDKDPSHLHYIDKFGVSKEIMSIGDKLCLTVLFCPLYVSRMSYCMPLRLKYKASNEFLVIAIWDDVEGGFMV